MKETEPTHWLHMSKEFSVAHTVKSTLIKHFHFMERKKGLYKTLDKLSLAINCVMRFLKLSSGPFAWPTILILFIFLGKRIEQIEKTKLSAVVKMYNLQISDPDI